MPMLVQICIVVATAGLLLASVALAIFLLQARRTARQVERTLAHVETDILPPLSLAVTDLRGAIDSTTQILARVDRITTDVQCTSDKALRFSNTMIDRFLVPAGEIAAIAQGIKVGVGFLRNGFGRKGAAEASRLQGGNSHE